MELIENFTQKYTRLDRRLRRAGLCAAASMLFAHCADAAPSWPVSPYTYYAENESLSSVLQRFAGNFSLSLRIGKGADALVNGRFNTASPTEFMDRLAGVYGFNWFVYAGTLFVSRVSEMETRTVSSNGGSISGLHQALQSLGVLDDRFGWGELPAQGLALVSGPPDYVALVEKTVNALPATSGKQEVAVFRLKYASVNDRIISYRDQQVVTPGLTTVLRNLISGPAGSAGNEALASIAAPLRDRPPSFGGMPTIGDATSAIGAAATVAPLAQVAALGGGMRMREPTVQADARLNAIIVQDVPERMPVYRALIDQLDVPSTLVEIEAMIVDVNSEVMNELGVKWGAAAGNTVFGYGSTGPGLVRAAGSNLAAGTMGIAVGSALEARLRALQTRNEANILSQPSILTADNMGAIIDLSDTFYISQVGERVASVTPITVGTSLRVTPRYIEGKDGAQVELTVDIEDGQIQEEKQVEGLPRVRKSNISTLAIVGNDQALLIGGYNSTQDSKKVEKVPFLGDIPFLGALFSHSSDTKQRRERLFLIRPRVISANGAQVLPVAFAGRWGNTLGRTWDDPDVSALDQDMALGLRLAESGSTVVRRDSEDAAQRRQAGGFKS
jgi:type III secretion protein C